MQLEIPGDPSSLFPSHQKWEWVLVTHSHSSLCLGYQSILPQSSNFFLTNLFVPARFFHFAYVTGTQYVVKRSSVAEKDSLVLLNGIGNLNCVVQSVYSWRDPSSQSSAPQVFPPVPSVHTSLSMLCTHLILTGHVKYWIPWFPSQSQHIVLPYHILPLLLAFSTVSNSIKVCKASKMKRWGNHSLRGQSHRSWEWEERLGLVMDVQTSSLHSTVEERAQFRLAAFKLFSPRALLKLVSVSKETCNPERHKAKFLQPLTICAMNQLLRSIKSLTGNWF